MTEKTIASGMVQAFTCLLVALIFSWISTDVTAQQSLTLYLSPRGDDTRTGLTTAQAIRTLARAHFIVKSTLAAAHRDVDIVIAPGTYTGGQTVVWKFTMPGKRITFRSSVGIKERPVFTGNGAGTWFTLRHSGGQVTNLVFEYLHVRDYATAISLVGNRESSAMSNSGNRIYGMHFSQVGEGSTAVIRLVNSDANEIISNVFVDIVSKDRCGHLHALYIAHDSSDNRIERNRFERNCGDPVRIRDFSNHNIISENKFIRAGVNAGYTEWYCDKEARTGCTKRGPECPSWGNEFRDNELQSNWEGSKLRVFKLFRDDTQAGCAAVPQGMSRLLTSGNK